MAVAGLVVMVGAAVHEGGEAVADADLHGMLRGPHRDRVFQVAGALVRTDLLEQ